MPLPSHLTVYLGASVALLLLPGPAVLYITARGMSQGVRAGLVSVLAIESGNAIQALAAALGLAAVLASSPLAFATVRLAGAAYIGWLGVRKLVRREPAEAQGEGEPPPRALRAIYAEGFIVAVLNPKTALFFLAFLPQFVEPARGGAAVQVLVLGAIFIALATVTDGAYALLSGAAGRWLRRHPGFTRSERWVSAAVYLGLGAFAALSGGGPAATGP
jgi:threonine/homoserine/homoserine lactone efflux protein